jgi:hypothetical protein
MISRKSRMKKGRNTNLKYREAKGRKWNKVRELSQLTEEEKKRKRDEDDKLEFVNNILNDLGSKKYKR